MSTNDITGARLVSKPPTKQYKENYDKIFGKSKNCCANNTDNACVSSRYDLDVDQTYYDETSNSDD